MISIASRLRPFSHQPGIRCLIPGTAHEVEVFPALVRIAGKGTHFKVRGPLKQFTVMQDLERGCVTVWGEGLFYHILPSLEIVTTKHPHLPSLECKERLSLGSHKKQEWEGIKRRCDVRELFPLWMRLGQCTPKPPSRKSSRGVFALLDEIKAQPPEHVASAFVRLFRAGFTGMFFPRLFDDEYQGIVEESAADESPLHLLTEGAEIIRALFVREDAGSLSFLPHLPPECFAGRMVNITTSFGDVDFEWTKKSLRRVAFLSTYEGSVRLVFQSSLKRFRLRCGAKDRGKSQLTSEPIEIKSGELYLLDNFER